MNVATIPLMYHFRRAAQTVMRCLQSGRFSKMCGDVLLVDDMLTTEAPIRPRWVRSRTINDLYKRTALSRDLHLWRLGRLVYRAQALKLEYLSSSPTSPAHILLYSKLCS